MSIYADSSLLVSLYVTDLHSQEAYRRLQQRPKIWLTPLHRVEFAHAIGQNVFRRLYSSQDAAQVYSSFEADRQKGFWLEVATPDRVFETAIDLAMRYITRLGCRTLDTLHIASAIELGTDEFWSFDERQLKLAHACGLKAS